MKAHIDHFPSSALGKQPVTFRHHAEPGSEVLVAGEFNRWNPVADGEWTIDCNCKRYEPNEFGSLGTPSTGRSLLRRKAGVTRQTF